MQASVLLVKLKIYEQDLKKRQEIAVQYDDFLRKHLETPKVRKENSSAWAQYSNPLTSRAEVQKKLKEKGLDLAQVAVIFVLLILPQIFGQFVITLFGVTEVKHYLNIFIPLTGIMITYFLFIMYFHQLLINRIYDLVYLKYLVVILILFWIMYDGVTAYYMQSNFTILQNKN